MIGDITAKVHLLATALDRASTSAKKTTTDVKKTTEVADGAMESLKGLNDYQQAIADGLAGIAKGADKGTELITQLADAVRLFRLSEQKGEVMSMLYWQQQMQFIAEAINKELGEFDLNDFLSGSKKHSGRRKGPWKSPGESGRGSGGSRIGPFGFPSDKSGTHPSTNPKDHLTDSTDPNKGIANGTLP